MIYKIKNVWYSVLPTTLVFKLKKKTCCTQQPVHRLAWAQGYAHGAPGNFYALRRHCKRKNHFVQQICKYQKSFILSPEYKQ